MMNYFSEETIRALGTMLAHSLWQITVIALLLKLITPTIHSSHNRYKVYFGGLCLILVSAIFTFYLVCENSVPSFDSNNSYLIQEIQVETTKSFADTNPNQSLFSVNWFQKYHTYLVYFWLLGAFGLLIKLLLGVFYTRKILNTQTKPIEPIWQSYLNDLIYENGLKKSINLLESALINVPCVIGYIKPVILLPIGLVNQLPEKEVEAILAHELAHIIRQDWVLNIFQSIVESIFYFHPALWWISEKIRVEREHCCDDYVLNRSNQLTYAKALLHTQEFSMQTTHSSPSFAMALDGDSLKNLNKHKFLHRIQRILNQPQVKSPIMEKITATGILLLIVTLLSLRLESAPSFAQKIAQITNNPIDRVNNPSEQPLNAQISTTTDTVPNGSRITQKISTDNGKQKVEMTLENDQITALNVDGKDIPASDFDKYTELTSGLIENMRADNEILEVPEPSDFPELPDLPDLSSFPDAPAMPPFPSSTQIITNKDKEGNTTIRLEQNGKPTEIIVKDGVVFIDGVKVESGEAIEINDANGNSFTYNSDDARADDETMRQHEKDMKKHEKDMKKHEKDMDAHEKDMKKHEKQMLIIEKRIIKEQEADQKEQEKKMRKIEKQIQIRTQEIDENNPNPNKKIIRREDTEGDDFGILLKQELQKDNLIKGRAFAIELSKDKFFVNGEKQPDAVHQKYLNLFEKATGNKLEKQNKVVIEEN
jgi:bla regulator protein blaR1